MKTSTLKSIRYHFKLFAHKVEDYTKQQIIVMTRFQKQFEIKETARDQIFSIFFESFQNSKNVRFKKRASRRKRDLIEREMTNANEIAARR